MVRGKELKKKKKRHISASRYTSRKLRARRNNPQWGFARLARAREISILRARAARQPLVNSQLTAAATAE